TTANRRCGASAGAPPATSDAYGFHTKNGSSGTQTVHASMRSLSVSAPSARGCALIVAKHRRWAAASVGGGDAAAGGTGVRVAEAAVARAADEVGHGRSSMSKIMVTVGGMAR